MLEPAPFVPKTFYSDKHFWLQIFELQKYGNAGLAAATYLGIHRRANQCGAKKQKKSPHLRGLSGIFYF